MDLATARARLVAEFPESAETIDSVLLRYRFPILERTYNHIIGEVFAEMPQEEFLRLQNWKRRIAEMDYDVQQPHASPTDLSAIIRWLLEKEFDAQDVQRVIEAHKHAPITVETLNSVESKLKVLARKNKHEEWKNEIFKMVWGNPDERAPDSMMLSTIRRIASEKTGYWPTEES